ncbi:MAG: toxin ParE1/3/4 [Polaribacter sp.]|jgi:toxin ParE1/3/4
MKYRIEFLEVAEAELEDTIEWYESQKQNLGAELLLNLDKVFSRIIENPRLFPLIHKEVRKATISTFPYSVIYEIHDPEVILILAIAHQKRNPSRWINR